MHPVTPNCLPYKITPSRAPNSSIDFNHTAAAQENPFINYKSIEEKESAACLIALAVPATHRSSLPGIIIIIITAITITVISEAELIEQIIPSFIDNNCRSNSLAE